MQTSKDSTGLAKQYLIKQLSLILSENLKSDGNVVLEKGTFGVVTLGKLPYISNENVAVKRISLKTSNLIEIKAKLKVLHTLSGYPSFPYCYGFVDSDKIVMQFIGKFINDKPIITTIQSMMWKKLLTFLSRFR